MFDSVSQSLERYMDLLAKRQQLIASNIANADTPGYRTKDFDFQSEFRALVEDTPHSQAPSHERPVALTEPDGLLTHNDGNNVSVDREARLLSENAIRFGIATAMLRARLRMVRSAIQEGKS